jgi:hypothetical protein
MSSNRRFLEADPAAFSDDELAEATGLVAAHLHAATYRLLLLVAEVDRRILWGAHGAKSCAHWLAWACGIDRITAREYVRVGRALEQLPLIAEALRSGEVGYSKVRALTRVATPDNEADLLNIGLHGTANHVESFVRHYRRVLANVETGIARERQSERCVHYHYDDDGTFVLNARLPPESGAVVLRALDAAMEVHEAEQPAALARDESYPQDASAERFTPPVPRTRRRADALVWLAERALEGGEAPALARLAPEIVVHVDAGVLADDAPGRSQLENGPAVAAETVRRLACDAGVVGLIERDGEPLSVGRRTRSIPPALRRALHARDRGCRFPGCDATHRLHGHHVRHWARGGETSLSNLALLCPLHHRAVHEGGFDIERLDDGALRFIRPDGRPLTPPEGRVDCDGALDAFDAHHLDAGLDLKGDTPMARWTGETFDYDQGIWAFFALYHPEPTRERGERDRTADGQGPAF